MRGSEKAEMVPTPPFPLVGPAEQQGPCHHPEPPAPRPSAALLPGPRPSPRPPIPSGAPTAWVVVANRATPPSPELARREALRCYAAAAAVAAAVAREREGGGGGGGGILAAGILVRAIVVGACAAARGVDARLPRNVFNRYSSHKTP